MTLLEPSTAPIVNQVFGAIGVLLAMACVTYLRKISKNIAIFKDEHDILWEDFNIRHNLAWRRHMGRGRSGAAKANGAAAGTH